MSQEVQIAFLLGMFAFGAVAGTLCRSGPLSGWAALVFPAVFPPVSVGMMMLFC